MKRTEQKKFVRDLSRNIANEICAKLDAEKLPERWGGGELRCLLADWHADGCAGFWSRMSTADRKDYRNVFLEVPGMPCSR